MRKFARQAAILAALALAITGCAPTGTDGAKLASGEKLKITREVWSDYEQYVQQGLGLGPDRNGAFGVALAVECLIFARNDEIQLPYEIID
jgi:hypothetical protein